MPRIARPKLPGGWKPELITPRMKKLCDGCGEVPNGTYRVVHSIDSYPFPTSKTYCGVCAVARMKSDVQAAEQLIRDFQVTHGKG